MTPLWLWAAFVFVMGSCIGSFLNVVIWRLPRGGSIRKPDRSYCPHCEKPIAWYDNFPIISWLLLRAKCRQCGGPISARYPLVELLTGLMFVGLLLGVFAGPLRLRPVSGLGGVGDWPDNWPGYLAALVMMSGLLAGSAIDLEHFFIPLPVVWIGGLVAVALSTALPGPWLPQASPAACAWGIGGAGGLLIAIGLLWVGVLPLSFAEEGVDAPAKPTALNGKPDAGTDRDRKWEARPGKKSPEDRERNRKPDSKPGKNSPKDRKPEGKPVERESVGVTVGARREVLKEVLFLMPVIVAAALWGWLASGSGPLGAGWARLCGSPHVRGLGGSLFGLLIGGAVIWSVRIIGTLIAGREAMGLGDVHLLAAAGALIGWGGAVLAFFISPFFGLAVGVAQWVRHGRRELPFGPYLSLGVLTVLLFYHRLAEWLAPTLRVLAGGGN